MNTLRIALGQINTIVGDLPHNQDKILSFVERARQIKADVVVFPELAICGYPPEDLLHKAHFIDNNLKALKALASRCKGPVVIVGFVDRDRQGRIFNAAALIAGGQIKGIYRKQRLPNYGVFDEKRYFTAGAGTQIFKIQDVPVGVTICEDIWGEDGPHLAQARCGAQVLINISSSPYEMGKAHVREELLARRARQTRAFICYANLVGGQDELVFDGSSFIFDPRGKLLSSGRQFVEDLVFADIAVPGKPARSAGPKECRAVVVSGRAASAEKPALALAQPRRLAAVEEVYQALVLGTRDYVRKNGFRNVLIGMSGGVDSSLVATIACDAIGPENVVGVSMPSKFTSSGTRSDARKVAANLGIRFMEIPIKESFEAYLQSLKGAFAHSKTGVTEENLQARVRGNFLMALSNKFGWLVLTTGNKSEMAVGYCTLYGDMSGGFAVIKDILKTQVYELSEFRNRLEPKPLIPESVLKRAPTAELRPNQTDQDSLPPYPVLDAILSDYVEEHLSLADMIRNKRDPETCRKVIRLVDQSEYKRRQAPPGVKITSRAFGKDWRVPITNHYREF